MQSQAMAWTCSICSADWLVRATGLDPYSDRIKMGYRIGYPDCVDEWSGLKDTTCLVTALEAYGVGAVQEWVDWRRAVEVAGETASILNGLGWYHFVGVRGQTNWGGIWLANSAEGYAGVGDTLSEEQFDALGPFQVVRLAR